MGKKANKKKATAEQAAASTEIPAQDAEKDSPVSNNTPISEETLGEPGPIIEEIVDAPISQPQSTDVAPTSSLESSIPTSVDQPEVHEGQKLDADVSDTSVNGPPLNPSSTIIPKSVTVEEEKEEPSTSAKEPAADFEPQVTQASVSAMQPPQVTSPVPQTQPQQVPVSQSKSQSVPTPASASTPAPASEQQIAPVSVSPAEPVGPQVTATRRPSSTDSFKRRSEINAGTAWKALGTRSHAQDETSSTKSYRSSSTTTEAEVLADTREREHLRTSRLQDSIQNPPPPPAPSVPPSPMARFAQPFPDVRPAPRIPDHSHRYYPETVGQHNPPPSYYNQRHYGHPVQGGQPTPPYHSGHSYSPMEGSYRDTMGPRGNVHEDFLHRPPPVPGQLLLEGGDEANKIIGQLSSTIPEIQRLMARYHETQGKLGEREERIREAEAKQEEILRQQDEKLRDQYEYIYSLRRDLDSARTLHAADSDKFRHELGNFQDQQRGLQDRIREAEVKSKDLEGLKAQSEAQIAALEKEKASLDKAIPEERERLMKEFDEWKIKAKEEADAQHMAIASALLDKEKDHEAELAKKMDEMKQIHDSNTQQLEEQFAKTKTELESQVTLLRGELDDSIKRANELAADHETLKQTAADHQTKVEDWEVERTKMRDEWEGEHTQAKNGWDTERQQLQQQNEELTKNLATAQQGWDQDKLKLEALVSELRLVSETLGSEKERLSKLLSASVTTDLKSKGDAYYKDALETLCRHTLQLANEHFDTCPPNLSAETTSTIPSELPPFLANTPPAKHVRTAYIAHLISTILTRRIFSPFLFSLPRSDTATDTLLASMSSHLQLKSTKKEAIWRQHTLTAAFQCDGAKAQINSVAGSVVEDITAALKPFALPAARSDVNAAVRRIVKLAAETWRLARLERDCITASMGDAPPGAALWLPYDTSTATLEGDVSLSRCAPDMPAHANADAKVVLRVFPSFRRAPTPREMRLTDEEADDKGCVYSCGLALYEDSDVIVERREELGRTLDLESIVPEKAVSVASRAPSVAAGTTAVLAPRESVVGSGSGRAESAAGSQTGSVKPYSRILVPPSATSEKGGSVSGSPAGSSVGLLSAARSALGSSVKSAGSGRAASVKSGVAKADEEKAGAAKPEAQGDKVKG
ncbi:hypothetical protein EJ05DRAFT_224310 [Pseudovirgaria hyperparasitica]|uniref:Uncharacterized protein n=1 Tax=Pseudovirgaria hyperparasitica TaxID=470096 RepID=A0A6A6VRL4_9PEZI|nr:uncharacterized protein EJ05DRAFT_224310 [Pseudovirgaria hyperparasitica]KAF2753242.1 hypothetical protein EJ05DRAFT_224310 [Pseudovirgaria hyperparasitica]